MQRGIDLEPMARAWYEVKYNTFVDQVAIVLHPTIEGGQCSPDGLVDSTNSLIEIKIPMKPLMTYSIFYKIKQSKMLALITTIIRIIWLFYYLMVLSVIYLLAAICLWLSNAISLISRKK